VTWSTTTNWLIAGPDRDGTLRAADAGMVAAGMPTMESDLDVVVRWRSGDQVAGKDLFGRYFDQLHRFFSNKCSEPDEMVQSTFMALLKAREQFAGRSSFRTYLFTIARNVLYRHVKTLERDRMFDPAVSSIAQVSTTIGSKLARNQEHRMMCAALRTLPLDQQTILELHYWEDLEITTLAEIFECEAGAMRMRLLRARTALREAMLADKAAPREALANLETLDTWARRAAR
jgi:RNA polymerase sigma factor (sigma-70 family)